MATREELDLHGRTVDEARLGLEQAVRSCFVRGVAELLVIHGHGRERENSGLLRAMVREWGEAARQRRPSFVASMQDGERTSEFRGNLGVTLLKIAIHERGNVYRAMRAFHVGKRACKEGELLHVSELISPAELEQLGFIARLVPRR